MGNARRRQGLRGCLRLQGDGVSEGLQLGDEALGRFGWVAALEVVAAEVAVDLAGLEHVPVGDQDRVLDGAQRAAVPEARLEALVLSSEIGALAADRGKGGFLEADPSTGRPPPTGTATRHLRRRSCGPGRPAAQTA